MPKYEIDQVVMVPCKVVEVHPQGFPFGLDQAGRPSLPPATPGVKHTPEEIAASQVEQADRVLVALPAGVKADSFGRLHLDADTLAG